MHKLQAQLPLVVWDSILVKQVHQGLGPLLQGTDTQGQVSRCAMWQRSTCLHTVQHTLVGDNDSQQ